MKQVILGDTHGRTLWKKILEAEKDADRIIFIGDYLDSFDVPGIDQLRNLEDILAYKKASSKEIILLIGNHDHHYFPEVGYTGTSGYQNKMATTFGAVLQKNRDLFKMAFMDEHGNMYTHAGISSVWLENMKKRLLDDLQIPAVSANEIIVAINGMWETHPKVFCYDHNDWGGYGDHVCQSPIWIRPQSLSRCKLAGNTMVVGHTGVKKISNIDGIWLTDNIAGGEYLVCIDGEFVVKQQL